jgi:toxin CptA
MHNAPSVSYPVGRCRFAAALGALAWLAGGAGLGMWSAQAQAPGWQLGSACAVWLGCGAAAALAWLRSPAGILAWDGREWSWDGTPVDGQPAAALDLQAWLLLRVQGQPRWLWLERAVAPQHWDALRRAVYSPATTAAPQGAKPPVVHP